MKNQFELVSEYKPSGDQPEAIRELVSGLKEDKKFQVLLGATELENIYNFECDCPSESTNLGVCT